MQEQPVFSTKNEPPNIPTADPAIIVVIPAHNDESTIGSIILKAKPLASKIIVVDDCSIDRTSEVARLTGADVISLQKDPNKGKAIIVGLKKAHDLGCKVAVLMDGDTRYKTREIPWVTAHIINGDADVVIGSRFLEKTGDLPVKQRIKQKMLQLPHDPPHTITDPFSGFMAFSSKALQNLDFPFEAPNFKQNFLVHLIAQKLSLWEVAVSERPGIIPKISWDYSLCVIAAFPAYNEEIYLPKTIQAAKPYVDAVVVVDDGSTDATQAVAQQMGAIVIRHDTNMGYGAALQTIFSLARDLHAGALVILDADGQHDPRDIEKVFEPLINGADVVIGSRFLDKTKNNIPQYRKAGMKVLDTAASIAGVKKVTDTQSGFRAYGKRAIDAIRIKSPGMSAGSEILIQTSDNNLNLVEVPITVRYDLGKTSTHHPVSHGLSVLGRIIALISYRRPLPAFGIPGFILVIVGLGVAFIAFTEYYATTKIPFALSMISAMLLLFGLLLGIAGLILNALIVIVHEKEGRNNNV